MIFKDVFMVKNETNSIEIELSRLLIRKNENFGKTKNQKRKEGTNMRGESKHNSDVQNETKKGSQFMNQLGGRYVQARHTPFNFLGWMCF